MKTPVFCTFCNALVLNLVDKNNRLSARCDCPTGFTGVENLRGTLDEGYIYCIGEVDSDQFVKIGFTKNEPIQRLGSLQGGNPRSLVLHGFIYGDMSIETILHNTFKKNIKKNDEHRLHNGNRSFFREWFYNEGLVRVFYNSIKYLETKKIGKYDAPYDIPVEKKRKTHLNRLFGPWVKMGISESTFYRRGLKIEKKSQNQ